MLLIIDGKSVSYNVGTLSLVLREEIERLFQSGRYVEQVSLNGRSITVDAVLRDGFTCEDNAEINITTYTLDEMITDVIESATQITPGLYNGVTSCIKELRSGNVDGGLTVLSSSLDGLNWHLQILDQLTKLNPGPSSIHELNDDLHGLLPKMYEAMDIKDSVLLADILEYELLTWFQRWFAIQQLFHTQMKLEMMKTGIIQ